MLPSPRNEISFEPSTASVEVARARPVNEAVPVQKMLLPPSGVKSKSSSWPSGQVIVTTCGTDVMNPVMHRPKKHCLLYMVQPPRPSVLPLDTRKLLSSTRQPTPKSPTDLSKLSYVRRTRIGRPATPT